jgi:transposase
MIIHPGFVGIDVAKHHLDIFEGGRDGTVRLANRQEAVAELIAHWRDSDVLIVFEATGHYDRLLRRALAEAGIRYARINPARARDFARAAGFLAKTDAVDARMLAALGQCLAPQAQGHIDLVREQLALAHKRRDQLVQDRQKERTRLRECTDPEITADIEAHLAWLAARVAQWDKTIRALVAQCDALETIWRQLRSIPGIGPVAAATLIARMPELGSLSPAQVAAMAGLAPFNVDSGQFRGTRKIRGGRKRVRDALYMAAVAAARYHPRFKTFYARLRAAGKPAKLAFIAVARKLLLIANALLRDKTLFQT